ncbi:uncharacterized protein LOC142550555 [Primulina tabacum]|uniref:uncharacterized protein LOC142550555 n=1 Tax=Primulina tabacum TaxID=48773 RepID=UPI003F59BC05
MECLRDLPAGSITTWDGLVEVFLNRYFPPTKITQLRNDITYFRQKDGESLNSAWARFKKMLRMCPRHGFSTGQQVETLYYGVDPSLRSMHDAASNGSPYRKTLVAALEIISSMTECNKNSTQVPVKPSQNNGPSMPPGFKKSESKSNLEDMLAKYIAGNEMRWQNHDAMMQMVETQLGQLANQFATRAPSSLPSDTEKNPKGVNAIIVATQLKKEDIDVDVEGADKEKVSSKNRGENVREKEALAQIPSYAKFLKEILSNKRKLVEFETVKLSEECYAILQNKLPLKLKNPGSFSIPCTIGSSFFSKALCDRGASIKLMPYSCFEKLGIGEIKPTTIFLQLADRSIKYPRVVVEDVLVKVDKFIFPVDFVVLDMVEDREIPLILGRPFLATGKAMIDVEKELLRDGMYALIMENLTMPPVKIIFPFPNVRKVSGTSFYCFLDGYSATFQRCIMAIFHDMIEEFIEIFMDYFSVFGSSFDACLINLSKVIEKCEESNLVLNWEKCHFMVREGIVLGHKISEHGIEVDKAKIEVIEKLPPPTNVKGV